MKQKRKKRTRPEAWDSAHIPSFPERVPCKHEEVHARAVYSRAPRDLGVSQVLAPDTKPAGRERRPDAGLSNVRPHLL